MSRQEKRPASPAQDEIDRIVISKAGNDLAWERAVHVKRSRAVSLSLPGEEPSEAYTQRIMSGDAEAFACEAEGQAPMDDQHLPPSGPPMMFFAAEHDPLAVQTCHALPSRFPYARYTYIPGESHFVTRKPAAFLPLLRKFWSTLPD